MNAVIYARFSSYSQTEQSIEGQLRVCREYAGKNKINIIAEYIDRATTGTNDNRPEFQKMIADASKKEFQQILVYKLDRFARNKYDSVVYKHKLAQYGVKVISATEMISDTPEGALMEGLLEMFAEMYSKDLSQKVKRGIKESVIKGNFIGGTTTYGYKVENKKLVIDEKTAPAVRYLFEEYANGKSKKQIMQELNQMGYTINGKPFTYNSLQNNLKNKKYIGIFESEQITNENYCPPIVSQDLFNRVQIKLNEHKHAPATQKAKTEYLLTSKAFCGHCGSPMVGTGGTSKTGKTHNYYNCSKQHKFHTCNKHSENKTYLEDYVVEQTIEYILKPEQMEKIADGMLKLFNHSSTAQKIAGIEKSILKIEKDMDKCFNSFINAQEDYLQKRLNEQIKSLAIQKQDFENEIKKMKLAEQVVHTKDEIIEIISQYLDYDKNNFDFKKKIINTFVNSVYIFDDKIAIYYNLFGSDKITYEEAKENIAQNESVHILNGTLRQTIVV